MGYTTHYFKSTFRSGRFSTNLQDKHTKGDKERYKLTEHNDSIRTVQTSQRFIYEMRWGETKQTK